jgi:hypothetical protein
MWIACHASNTSADTAHTQSPISPTLAAAARCDSVTNAPSPAASFRSVVIPALFLTEEP